MLQYIGYNSAPGLTSISTNQGEYVSVKGDFLYDSSLYWGREMWTDVEMRKRGTVCFLNQMF